ncbi:TPA: hypothetical protein NBM48_002465 [Corynebacterium striatum]|nr:hypothetical protein [Corynebacterium striatum]
MKSPNLTKRQTNQKPTPSKKQQHRFLIRLANPKITIQRKITTTPNPTGQNKGGSQTTKMIHAISMHTKQTNLIIYNRALIKKGPIRHTPHQPNT